MTQIATGVFKKLSFKKQTAQGTIAPGGATTEQTMRRVTSTIDLKKAQYRSNEINASQQRRDSRHGVKSVAGTISGELSNGTYQAFFESVLRQLVQTQATTGAITTVTAALTATPAGTFTRSGGSYLTDGFKIGDLVSWTGWATTGVPNNSHNMVITALTATVMTCYPLDAVPIGAKASGDSVTCIVPGKKTWMPQSGHTRDYYTIEHNFSDIVQSEQFMDCVISAANVKLPPTGMATIDFPVMGLNMQTGTTAYFTSPTATSTGSIMAAVNGGLFVNGTKFATITGIEININGNYTAPGGVVGTNIDPDIFPGVMDVSGTVTALFDSVTLRDAFINETQSTIIAALTADNTPGSNAIVFVMSNVKFGGADKDDGEKGLTLSMPFIASENVNGGVAAANLQTTISIQDTTFA